MSVSLAASVAVLCRGAVVDRPRLCCFWSEDEMEAAVARGTADEAEKRGAAVARRRTVTSVRNDIFVLFCFVVMGVRDGIGDFRRS